MITLTGHPVVDAVAQLNLQGNMVHHSWYQHLRYINKRGEFTDPWACLILADIVYWHRPVEVRDESTGHIIGYRKKFADDKLQRSLESFSQLLGCSCKVAREALTLLEKIGVVQVEVRPHQTKFGVIPSAMFVTLVPDRLQQITHPLSMPETLEKSFIPKWDRRNAEMGTPLCPNGYEGTPKWVGRNAEMGILSLYRDFSENTQKSLSPQTPLSAPPEPEPEEERERILKKGEEKPKEPDKPVVVAKPIKSEQQSQPLDNLTEGEREPFEKFVRDEYRKETGQEIRRLHSFLADQKDFDYWHDRFIISSAGQAAKQEAIAAQYDWPNHPRLKEFLQQIIDAGGWKWTQQVEAEREWRAAFYEWAFKSQVLADYAEEVYK